MAKDRPQRVRTKSAVNGLVTMFTSRKVHGIWAELVSKWERNMSCTNC